MDWKGKFGSKSGEDSTTEKVMASAFWDAHGEKERGISQNDAPAHMLACDGQNHWTKIAFSRTLLSRLSLVGLFALPKLEEIPRWFKRQILLERRYQIYWTLLGKVYET